MTNNLLVKATALLESKTDAATAANLALEIVPAYQDLVRRMADAMEESYKRLNAAGYAVGEARIALLEEARAAITHTPTDS